MARLAFFLVSSLSIYFHFTAAATTAAATSTSSYANFVKSSCSAVQYPALCVQSLAAYASTIKQSPQQLAQTALAVSLARARSTKDFVVRAAKFRGLKAREYEAIKDCLEEMDDSVDRLAKSAKELKSAGGSKGQDFLRHVSNVQTWVSAALTDVTTCLDGYASAALNGRLKTSIRSRALNVAQVTSNALALVNRYASKP
ncbi:21 kDa protein-like [Syzygium oleosum]|uniref:21 kDa protein-like n=1 Tax=Syzygium oleosum TaxID=219896 RepID=UPI0011D20A25|nr:21 kDa protein-like [Syzygium oleosum]